MTPVRLNLPADLKRRIEAMARAANQTPQAFMRDALTRELHRAEAHRNEAAEEVGDTFELGASFDYLSARIFGALPRRPRARRARTAK